MDENRSHCVAILMAGGSGTRFWPLSRPHKPKQFLPLTSSKTLIQETFHRLKKTISQDSIFVCADVHQKELLSDQLPEVETIFEPCSRNTSPCLMRSLQFLYDRGYSQDTVMVATPSDHAITHEARFAECLEIAIETAIKTSGLVTLGVAPTSPSTAYGYIEVDSRQRMASSQPILQFCEKPDLSTAKKFLESGRFYWNTGVFIWTLRALERAFEEYQTKDWNRIKQAQQDWKSLEQIYPELTALPIDKAILEKATKRFVIPALDIGWSDLGSWNALYHLRAQKPGENIVMGEGNPLFLNSEGCLIHSENKKVAIIGLKDIAVIETEDCLLVVPRQEDQRVGEAAKVLK